MVRWRGPTVGMMRVQQQFARHARANRRDVVFTVFDPFANRPRAIRPEWVDPILEGRAGVEPALVWNPGAGEGRLLRRLPRAFAEASVWITRARRKAMAEAERAILSSPGQRNAAAEGRIRRLMRERERPLYFNEDGSLRPCPPLDMILDDSLELATGDVFIGAQSDWYHVDIDEIARLQKSVGLRHVVLCYDIIPILFPQWYKRKDGRIFESYFRRAFRSADRVIFNARSNERDAGDYCRSLGFTLPDTAIVRLGSDIARPAGTTGALPDGLERGRFALYVSTIEPRKNHAVLLDAWRRLAAEGTIAATGFKLVFVGRRGWMVEELFAKLEADPEFGRSIIYLEGVSDETLAGLYSGAAFSLYPSIYEGYGLPPTESMQAGTPVIASTGGALAEVVGENGVRLEPQDRQGWHREMRRMILDTAYREEWAARARRYRPIPWREAAERFFDAVTAPFPSR
jgi:glycosyltransferase involved in cell wall biosynthesis